MELGEAHAVGVLHDEGIHVGDVDAGLDDGGADQDVRLALHHLLHDGGKLLLPHLAVAHGDAGLGAQELLEPGGHPVDALHPVVEEVDLAAPVQLPAAGVRQDAPVLFENVGLDGLAVPGRLLQGGHIPQAREGHVEGTGDGGRGEGQGVHLAGHLPELFLVADAEALLLVDDEEA